MNVPVELLVVIAVVVGLLAASKLSRAGRIAPALQPMVGKAVDVRVWGTPISGFRVHTVRAFSAALLIRLQPVAGGNPILLKVAQPRSARHDERTLVIDDARYMQWRGARIPRVEGLPAMEVTVIDE